MKRIVILTGNELRHQYFRVKLSSDKDICVLGSFCESAETNLKDKTFKNQNSTLIEQLHFIAREQSEKDFFEEAVSNIQDESNPRIIPKGSINNYDVVSEINKLNPDLIVCYGSSLIKSSLLHSYNGRFLNVHLGITPYYRGSGTNVWPIINGEFHMVGATFMHIDEGIDTGRIIHQIQAEFFIGDSPHSVGNRLIKEMTSVYCELIKKFDTLSEVKQTNIKGTLYLQKDFDSIACERLYEMCNNNLIFYYLSNSNNRQSSMIFKNSVIHL